MKYRLRLEREGDRVRLFTRNGHDWSSRYPCIDESTLKNRYKRFVFDGEAVVLGVDGISDFNALHSRRQDEQVQLYAFDILSLDGDDLRKLPLSMRKTNLARLLAGRPDGIFIAPFEQGEIDSDLFEAACRMGLEGLVSKHRERAYRPRTAFEPRAKAPAVLALMHIGCAFSHVVAAGRRPASWMLSHNEITAASKLTRSRKDV